MHEVITAIANVAYDSIQKGWIKMFKKALLDSMYMVIGAIVIVILVILIFISA